MRTRTIMRVPSTLVSVMDMGCLKITRATLPSKDIGIISFCLIKGLKIRFTVKVQNPIKEKNMMAIGRII